MASDRKFVLQKVHSALLELMDGSVSTFAPIFAGAGADATADVTGRGGPIRRGAITGIATAIGGMLHSSPSSSRTSRLRSTSPTPWWCSSFC
jgi:erythrin-vacuolar iron transport family protein